MLNEHKVVIAQGDDMDLLAGTEGLVEDRPSAMSLLMPAAVPTEPLDVLREKLEPTVDCLEIVIAPEPTLDERVDQFVQRDEQLRSDLSEMESNLGDLRSLLERPATSPDASIDMVAPHRVNYMDGPVMSSWASKQKQAVDVDIRKCDNCETPVDTKYDAYAELTDPDDGSPIFLCEDCADKSAEWFIFSTPQEKGAAKDSFELLGLPKAKSTGHDRDQKDIEEDDKEMARQYTGNRYDRPAPQTKKAHRWPHTARLQRGDSVQTPSGHGVVVRPLLSREDWYQVRLDDGDLTEHPEAEMKVEQKKAAQRTKTAERKIVTSYTTVTWPDDPAGEYQDEHGWVDEEGSSMEPDEVDQEDGLTAVDLAVKFLQRKGPLEPSSTSFYQGVWYTGPTIEDRAYFEKGEDTQHSFHLRGFTEEEEKAIFDGVTKGMRGIFRDEPKKQAYLDTSPYHEPPMDSDPGGRCESCGSFDAYERGIYVDGEYERARMCDECAARYSKEASRRRTAADVTPEYTFSVKRLPDTNEWKVVVRVDGKISEEKSSYHDDKQDAINTMNFLKNEVAQGKHTKWGKRRVAVAPPGKEKMVRELKKNPDVDNPYAVAWSQYDKEKKAHAGRLPKQMVVLCAAVDTMRKTAGRKNGAAIRAARLLTTTMKRPTVASRALPLVKREVDAFLRREKLPANGKGLKLAAEIAEQKAEKRAASPSSEINDIAETLWEDAVSTAAEYLYEDTGEKFEGSGSPPQEALYEAAQFAKQISDLNGGKSLYDIYSDAVKAEYKYRGRDSFPDFLYLITMESLGHGIGWDDWHHDFKLPRIENPVYGEAEQYVWKSVFGDDWETVWNEHHGG